MFWDFLIEYKAIFASILTLIATLVVTQILRNIGKIQFTFTKLDFKITVPDASNQSVEYSNIEKKSTFREVILRFELILYNDSETSKSLSDFSIELTGKNDKAIFPIKDTATTKSDKRGLMFWTEELMIINLPPKTMSHYKLKCYPNKNFIKDEEYKIYFICKNTKGKIIRKYISSHQFIVN